MKHFTPELFIDYNSPDDEVANRANERWDEAEIQYKNRLSTIKDKLPEEVRELSRICLHDAEVLSRQTIPKPIEGFPFERFHPFWSTLEVITLRQNTEIVSLFYSLTEPVRTTPTPDEWRFSKGVSTWLYDEIDLLDERWKTFSHRVMLSTGVTLEIIFISVLIHRFSLNGASAQTTQAPAETR